jgi:transposase
MTIITIGIDLAKNVFAVHGVNEHSKPELIKPKVPSDQLLPLIANLPPWLIGMEACSSKIKGRRAFAASRLNAGLEVLHMYQHKYQ